MDRSTPGLPIHHQLPELIQTQVRWVGDAIQPSHPLSSASPPTSNLSQQQDLFQWVSSLHQLAKILECQLQHQSFQWTPRSDLLQDGLVGCPCSPRDSQESSPTPQSIGSQRLGDNWSDLTQHSTFVKSLKYTIWGPFSRTQFAWDLSLGQIRISSQGKITERNESKRHFKSVCLNLSMSQCVSLFLDNMRLICKWALILLT